MSVGFDSANKSKTAIIGAKSIIQVRKVAYSVSTCKPTDTDVRDCLNHVVNYAIKTSAQPGYGIIDCTSPFKMLNLAQLDIPGNHSCSYTVNNGPTMITHRLPHSDEDVSSLSCVTASRETFPLHKVYSRYFKEVVIPFSDPKHSSEATCLQRSLLSYKTTWDKTHYECVKSHNKACKLVYVEKAASEVLFNDYTKFNDFVANSKLTHGPWRKHFIGPSTNANNDQMSRQLPCDLLDMCTKRTIDDGIDSSYYCFDDNVKDIDSSLEKLVNPQITSNGSETSASNTYMRKLGRNDIKAIEACDANNVIAIVTQKLNHHSDGSQKEKTLVLNRDNNLRVFRTRHQLSKDGSSRSYPRSDHADHHVPDAETIEVLDDISDDDFYINTTSWQKSRGTVDFSSNELGWTNKLSHDYGDDTFTCTQRFVPNALMDDVLMEDIVSPDRNWHECNVPSSDNENETLTCTQAFVPCITWEDHHCAKNNTVNQDNTAIKEINEGSRQSMDVLPRPFAVRRMGLSRRQIVRPLHTRFQKQHP